MFSMIRWLKVIEELILEVNININTRDDEESVGEMHMKDYVDIDVSNQENVAPVYFQSLSLD